MAAGDPISSAALAEAFKRMEEFDRLNETKWGERTGPEVVEAVSRFAESVGLSTDTRLQFYELMAAHYPPPGTNSAEAFSVIANKAAMAVLLARQLEDEKRTSDG